MNKDHALSHAVMMGQEARAKKLLAEGYVVDDEVIRWMPVSSPSLVAHLLGLAGVAEMVMNHRDQEGYNPCGRALTGSGNTAEEVTLLMMDAGVAPALPEGMVLLAEAGRFGRVRVVRRLLEDDSRDIRHLDADGQTLLHILSFSSKEAGDLVAQLVAMGIDANIRNGKGYAPLHIAAGWGNHDVAKALLAAGADPLLEGGAGETPSSMASDARTKALLKAAEAARMVEAMEGDISEEGSRRVRARM